jgi:hypothetical protein
VFNFGFFISFNTLLNKSRISLFLNENRNGFDFERGGFAIYYGYHTDTNTNDIFVITYLNVSDDIGDTSNAQIKLYLENAILSKRGRNRRDKMLKVAIIGKYTSFIFTKLLKIKNSVYGKVL